MVFFFSLTVTMLHKVVLFRAALQDPTVKGHKLRSVHVCVWCLDVATHIHIVDIMLFYVSCLSYMTSMQSMMYSFNLFT